MKPFSTFHCHPYSLDSGSTPLDFAKREIELGTGTITTTDHGTMGACRTVYDIAKDKGLVPILGLEGYLRDDNCPILKEAGIAKGPDGTYSNWLKYTHVTLHYQDYEAYLAGVRLLSKADLRAEKHGSERKPLFTWDDLEELGSYNVTFGSGCLIGACARHILDHNDLDMAIKYYEKLRGLAKPGCFYAEVFPHDCSKNWVSGTFITVKQPDGTERKHKWHAGKWLRTNVGEVRAEELSRSFSNKTNQHFELLAVKNFHTWEELEPAALVSVDHKEGFLDNECRPWAPTGDLQAGLNKVIKGLAKRYGDKVVISDDSHYATSDEKIVQDVRLAQSGNWKFYGQYERQSSDEAFLYFKTRLGTSEKEFEGWVENNQEWASRFKDFKFDSKPSLPTKFYEPLYLNYAWSSNEKVSKHDHSLMYTMELIKKHGRMDWKDPERVQRLKTEIELLHNNGTIDLLPYFMVDEEVCSLYERNGYLTGPGRGSAAGLFLSYLLGITHVDPIRRGLSLERFLTLDRIQSGRMPDIDQDLPHREILVNPETGWLKERFGDHYAQISVDITLKLKMAVKDVARFKLGQVPGDIEVLTKRFEMPPMGVNDYDFVMGYENDEDGHVPGSVESDEALKEYIRKYPSHWEIVKKCLGLSRQKGRHPCGFVLANQPIHTFIPLMTISDVRVTSYTASSVEAVGGLKMDFLVVNSLNDIGDAIQMEQQRFAHTVDVTKYKLIEHDEDLIGWGGPKFTNKRFSLVIADKRVPCQRLVPVNGHFYDIWDLAEDQNVFADIARSKTETVFQFNTAGAVKWLKHFGHKRLDGTYAIDSIDAMANFTALDRPGPLDMYVSDPDDEAGQRKHNLLVEYARRARGATPSSEVLEMFDKLIPETYGILVFQEQVQRVYQQLTGCTGGEAEHFRGLAAKKKLDKMEKLYAPFIEKAGSQIGSENAKAAWQFFITWAKYGFGKAHSVCYAVIAYACAYSKHHYSLEWWCAVLKNAAKNEVNEKFWQHCGHMIDLPDVSLSGPNFEIQNDRIRAPLSLLHGVGEGAHNQLVKYAPYTDIQDYCDKIQVHREATKYLVRRTAQQDGKNKWVKLEGDEAAKWLAATDDERTVGDVKWRPGHNALHRGITYTLIVSGAMDSLFPKDDARLIHDNLMDYEKALAKSTGKKKAAPVDEALVNLSPVARFQRRKAILPAYGEDLVKLLADTNHPIIQKDGSTHYFIWENTYSGDEQPIRFATYEELQEAEVDEMSSSERRQAAVVAYVEDSRVFNYGDERREACEVILDVEGGRFKYVKWSGKAKKVPAVFKSDLKGSIVIAVLSKYKADKPFAIEDLIVIENPLPIKNAKDEED